MIVTSFEKLAFNVGAMAGCEFGQEESSYLSMDYLGQEEDSFVHDGRLPSGLQPSRPVIAIAGVDKIAKRDLLIQKLHHYLMDMDKTSDRLHKVQQLQGLLLHQAVNYLAHSHQCLAISTSAIKLDVGATKNKVPILTDVMQLDLLIMNFAPCPVLDQSMCQIHQSYYY